MTNCPKCSKQAEVIVTITETNEQMCVDCYTEEAFDDIVGVPI